MKFIYNEYHNMLAKRLVTILTKRLPEMSRRFAFYALNSILSSELRASSAV